MPGIDGWLAGLGHGGAGMALVAAVLLGLRHATDPDHLAAVSTLVMAEEGAGAGGARRGRRRAGLLGLSWGLGHATTLFLVGLPVVLLGRNLPGWVQRGAEIAIGLVIVLLAGRLLVRWRRGHLHSHPHAHEGLRHTHPHFHDPFHAHGEDPGTHPAHRHRHLESMGRSPGAAYGIGLLHGVGGSAAAGVLLVAATPNPARAALALTLFAGGTAVSMACLSSMFGGMLTHHRVARHLAWVMPTLGVVSLTFGVWYTLVAW